MLKMKKYYNKLFLNDIRKAIDDYNLIENDDNILIGLSGGKDSIFLLYSLILFRERSFIKFNISALHIDIGIKIDMEQCKKFCVENNIDFFYKSIDIKEKVFNSRKSPCYICSNYKRGTMATFAKENNINKIAYGHHLTDLVNTFYLNIIKENQFRVFKPNSYNEKHNLNLIRPLVYIKEDIIKKVVKEENLPLGIGKLCPYDDKNERNKINKIVEYSNSIYENFEYDILKTIKNSDFF